MEEYLWSVWHIVFGFIIYMDATDRQDQAVWREDRRRIKSLCVQCTCAPKPGALQVVHSRFARPVA